MNSRKRRRAQRRIRRSVVTLFVVSLLAIGLFVLPAGGTSKLGNTSYSGDTADSISDIQSYWASTLPSVYGKKYQEIPENRIYPYSSNNPPPACGGRGTTPYQEVAGNAFYCDEGDFIAYDEQALIPSLRKQFGDFAVGLVMAHEWGHAVQTRVGFSSRTSVYVELQADCFAGAWAEHIASGESSLRLSDDDLDRALAGFLELRDPSGVDGGESGAHGNAFDRVGAFQDGLDGGAAACKNYSTNPPEVTEEGFTSYEDQAINGDLPLDEVLPILKTSLDDFWSGSFCDVQDHAEADGIRLDPRTVVQQRLGRRRAQRHGDLLRRHEHDRLRVEDAAERVRHRSATLAPACYVAAAWSSSVQHQLGAKLGTTKAREIGRVPHRRVGGSRAERHRVEPVTRVLVLARRSRRGRGHVHRHRRQSVVGRPRLCLRPGQPVPHRIPEGRRCVYRSLTLVTPTLAPPQPRPRPGPSTRRPLPTPRRVVWAR